MIDYQTQRHGGRWNVLYCDGHVLGESTKQFLDPRSDAVLRSWYRDHVPHVDIFDSLLAEVRRTRAGDVLAAEGGRVSSGSREVCGGAPRRNKPHTNAVGRAVPNQPREGRRPAGNCSIHYAIKGGPFRPLGGWLNVG